jgi:hypothetical protein
MVYGPHLLARRRRRWSSPVGEDPERIASHGNVATGWPCRWQENALRSLGVGPRAYHLEWGLYPS